MTDSPDKAGRFRQSISAALLAALLLLSALALLAGCKSGPPVTWPKTAGYLLSVPKTQQFSIRRSVFGVILPNGKELRTTAAATDI
jgi:hypothetical protein